MLAAGLLASFRNARITGTICRAASAPRSPDILVKASA